MATTTVTGTYLDPSGNPCTGRVVFRLVAATYHDGLDAIFPTVPRRASLDEDGGIEIELEPTSGVGAGFDALDMTYQVTERINGTERDPYYVDIPTSAAVDLGTLATYDDPLTVRRVLAEIDLDSLGYATDSDLTDHETSENPHPQIRAGCPILEPLYISHRGASAVFPEHTWQGYQYSMDLGYPLELDVRLLADGTMVSCHLPTVADTMDGTGNVVDKTLAQWRAMRVEATIAGGDDYTPILVDDVLDRWGGEHLIVAEAKTPDAGAALIQAIVARGLHRSVMFYSYLYSDCVAAGAAGILTAYINDSVGDGGNGVRSPATLLAAGIEWTMHTLPVAQAVSEAEQAGGLKVVAGAQDTRSTVATEIAKGVNGIFTKDPEWVDQALPAKRKAMPTERRRWPGFTYSGHIPLWEGVKVGWRPTDLSSVDALLAGWAGPMDTTTGTLTVRGRVHFGRASNDSSRHAYIYVGALPEGEAYQDGEAHVGQHGYLFAFRRNGVTNMWRIDDNDATPHAIGSAGTGSVVAGVGVTGDCWVEAIISATAVSCSIGVNGTTGSTNNDTTHRGSGLALSLGMSGCDALWSDVTVTET